MMTMKDAERIRDAVNMLEALPDAARGIHINNGRALPARYAAVVVDQLRAAAPPPAEPDHPLWPRCRPLMSPAVFRQWVAPLVEVGSLDGRRVLIAPSRFHADHCRAEFSQALHGFDIRARPEVAHG